MDNHKRVARINEALKQRGVIPWFDSESQMTGQIMDQVSRGIDNARVILVFVTNRYIEKVGGDNEGDNCKLEFQYTANVKTREKMLAVVMEAHN